MGFRASSRVNVPFFVTIPHAGERVPPEADWLKGLDEPTLMCDVDRFVDRLYEPVLRDMGIATIKTEWHRYVIDLNRLPDDVDRDSVNGHANPVGRFSSGLHWVKTTKGFRLMVKPVSLELHNQLVKLYFEPFHQKVEEIYARFRRLGANKIYHLDAHSMPSLGTNAHRDPGQKRADIVVSDCEGKSCESSFKDLVIDAYTRTGLKVAYNWPYVGGRLTETYGRPQSGQHAIQVEINRAKYMDEETKQWKGPLAQTLMAQLASAVRHIHQELALQGAAKP